VLGTLPSGWRNAPSELQAQGYDTGSGTVLVGYRLGRSARFEIDGEALTDIDVLEVTPAATTLLLDGVRRRFDVHRVEGVVYVDTPGCSAVLTELSRFPNPDELAGAGSMSAPMPGTVVQVAVSEGDRVVEGQVLIVLEAMKMEHRIVAPIDGIVVRISVEQGQMVDGGQVLVELEDAAAEEEGS
jgi:propionyl-CoA carboxylase alpha chain